MPDTNAAPEDEVLLQDTLNSQPYQQQCQPICGTQFILSAVCGDEIHSLTSSRHHLCQGTLKLGCENTEKISVEHRAQLGQK